MYYYFLDLMYSLQLQINLQEMSNVFLCERLFIRFSLHSYIYAAYRQKKGGGICLTAQSVIDPLIQGSVCDDEGLDSPRKEKYKYIQSKRVWNCAGL